MTEPLLTAQELAELLGVSASTILDKVQAGEIPHYRLWAGRDRRGRTTGPVRFRVDEVEEWLASCRVEARA